MSRTALLTTLAGVFVLLAGCSAEHHFRVASDALAKSEYDKAIENFQKAAEKKPDNEEYRDAVESAKHEATSHHLREATRLANTNDLLAAEKDASAALRYTPEHPEATNLLAEVRKRAAAAEARRADALRLAGEGRLDDAIQAMQEALAKHRMLPGGERDMARVRQSAADHWIAQAEAHLARDDWDQAEQAAQRAVGYLPQDSRSGRIFQEIANRRQAEKLVARAKTAMEQKRHEAALADLEQAARLYPDRSDIPALVLSAREAICDGYLARGRQLLEQGDHTGALKQFAKSRALLANYGNVDALVAEARADLARRHKQAADQAFAGRFWGNALLRYLLTDALVPGSVPKWTTDDCARKIRARLGYRVGVLVGAQHRIRFRHIIEAMEPAIIRHVAAVKPDAVSVLTQAQMKRALADHNLLPGDFFGPTAPVAARRLHSADAVILLKIVELAISTGRTRTTGKARVQSAVRMLDSPAHAKARSGRNKAAGKAARLKADLARLQRQQVDLQATPASPARDRRLGELQRDIAQTKSSLADARADLAAADRKLAATPRHLKQAVFGEHTFPVWTYTKTARLTVAVQIIDTATGRLLADDTINGSVTATDRVIKADPAHSIPADPLELPDDDDMRRQAVDRTTVVVQTYTESAAYRFAEHHTALAQAAVAERKTAAAIEHYVDYLFASPVANAATGQAFGRLLELLGHDPSLIDLRGALTARCRVLRPPARLPVALEERDGALWLTRFTRGGAPAGLRMPCRVVGVAGRPVHTVAAFDYAVNQYRPRDRVGLDVSDRDRVTRIFLTVELVAGP